MRTMSGGPCLHFDCTNRNSFGYCRTTVCINEHYQQEQWSSTSNRSENVVVKPQTNADRIRAMTDEELADIMYPYECVGCPVETKNGECLREGENCEMALLRWLKAPVEEGER